MAPNGGSLLLIALLVFSVLSVTTAKSGGWKIGNIGITIGCMALGLFTGLLGGAWSHNMALGGHLAATCMIAFGACGAFLCWRANTRRSPPLRQDQEPVKSESIGSVK
jgi:hypothetical protein